MTFLKKILLVDHEPKVTALVRRALESTGRFLVKVEADVRLAVAGKIEATRMRFWAGRAIGISVIGVGVAQTEHGVD